MDCFPVIHKSPNLNLMRRRQKRSRMFKNQTLDHETVINPVTNNNTPKQQDKLNENAAVGGKDKNANQAKQLKQQDALDKNVAVGAKDVEGVQKRDIAVARAEDVAAEEVVANKVFDVVEQPPTFAHGNIIAWLSQNIHYPPVAEENNIQGRVVVQFVVEKDGSLTEIKTVKSVNPLLDEEAVRVVSAMPKWEPGKQKGKAVRVKYNVPISFKLTGSATKTDGQTAPTLSPADAPTAQSSSEERIFEVVEKMPEFPGGAKALMEYISYNVRYPKEAQESGEQGRVIVGFIVEKDGTISNARVVRSNSLVLVQVPKDGGIVTKVETAEVSARHELETEALRVINAMPKWTPGKQNGNAVRVRYNIPVTFRLQ